MKTSYVSLLTSWCDKLLDLQVKKPEDKRVHGGIFCPACLCFHGRSWDAVYPLMYLYHHTGKQTYLEGAKQLFDWGENFRCDDGSFYNGTHNSWAATTIFAGISLCESLHHYGELLDEETRNSWLERLSDCCHWTYTTIDRDFHTNINYFCAAAALLSLAAEPLGKPEYGRRADELAAFCSTCFDQDDLLFGEGKPIQGISAKGCRPVDIGYNVEESLGMLLIYTRQRNNEVLLKQVKASLMAHLEFMLPDGGWNNSFGTRNFKWTYWGSRTSGGCLHSYGICPQEPVFAEAAARNLELMERCTFDGLLYGGPDYEAHGEAPCVHHTFSHAVGLAAALNADCEERKPCLLPAESRQGLRYYSSLDTYQIRKGGFYATVTGYDYKYIEGGHASGGTLSFLWHEQTGPLIASAMTAYSMPEPHNMQLSLKKSRHRSLTPRLEGMDQGKQYLQCNDVQAVLVHQEIGSETVITAGSKDYQLEYRFSKQAISIRGKVLNTRLTDVKFILPMISGTDEDCYQERNRFTMGKAQADLQIEADRLSVSSQPIFNLAPGFIARQCIITPDQNGDFLIMIYLRPRMG